MHVFISSVISGLEEYRDAAQRAAETLDHTVIRAEDFPASSTTPRRACLAGVRQADIVVLLLGARYGSVQASGLSPTHEEYREARDRRPVIVLVQEGVTRETEQAAFLAEVQDWSHGQFSASFQDVETLRDGLIRALHQLELSRATGPIDPEEMLDRARGLIPTGRGYGEARLVLAIVGGPPQAMLRPAELEKGGLAELLMREATYGDHRIFDMRQGTNAHIEGHALVVEQESASVSLGEDGSVRIIVPLRGEEADEMAGLPVIIEEEVQERLLRGLRYASDVLERVDSNHRLAHVAVVVTILDGEYVGWRTRAEHARSPNQIEIGMPRARTPVWLTPATRPRAALRLEAEAFAQDLTVLLRRQHIQ